MRWFRRKPELKDRAFAELAEMLFNDSDRPSPGAHLLDETKLDFRLESLRHLDDYLESMAGRSLSGRDGTVVVLRSGAYVGEVIRRNSPGHRYHWIDYDAAVRLDDRLKSLGARSLGLEAVLWDGDQGFIFPIAKVVSFLQNGREDSTYFFASVVIARIAPNFG